MMEKAVFSKRVMNFPSRKKFITLYHVVAVN
jgi:hypothetical protein